VLEEQARRLGLRDTVDFVGMLHPPEVAALMRRSHLFVLPSRAENLPESIIEAMACGLPIVATDVGGVRELVDERVGTLVPPNDSAALAHALERVLDAHCRYDGAEISRIARQRFSHEAVGRRWDDVYREVVSETARRR
jgi:glycosyltransferase involved in cell wall biosynthesis